MKKLLLTSIITIQSLFALVTITPVEIGEKAGLHGNIGASLETKRGSTDKDNYKSGVRLTYDNNLSYVTWGEVSGEYGESNNIEDTNKLYIHLRHIHSITDEVVRLELLAQVQKDKFKLINNRTLYGAGARFKLFELFENSKGYFGVGAFNEYISYTSNEADENALRGNSYLTYSASLNQNTSLSYTFYYQPILNEFSDNIQLHKFQLRINVYEKLYLNFNIAYDYDSKPPIGLVKEDFYQETALVFDF